MRFQICSGFRNLTELKVPNIPSAFVPLVTQNHQKLRVLEVGDLSNQLISIVCRHLAANLNSFTFVGGQITYSGVAALTSCKDSLEVLEIRDPKYLTKYSLWLLANHLRNLKILRLYWLGKYLISNPWSFEFCHDRQEQRVDSLFADGRLDQLVELDLSGFFQTVVDKTVQLICAQHLSSDSLTARHLRKVSLSHCFQVTDGGIQWLVGSCHSPDILELDLSSTDLTGQCFLRRMPRLTRLVLDCCSSLSGAGLCNIATSCPNLKYLSMSKNKHLTDDDLKESFKSGFRSLEFLNMSYSNITGRCFSEFRSAGLRRLNINCSPRLKDENLETLFQLCQNLIEVDLSVTNLSLKTILERSQLPNLKSLNLDFCPKIDETRLVERLPEFCPNVARASLFGTLCDVDGNVAELKRRLKTLKRVDVADPASSERDVRDFAKKRGLTLSNWLITQQRMVKSQPPMLSQIFLQSYQDH